MNNIYLNIFTQGLRNAFANATATKKTPELKKTDSTKSPKNTSDESGKDSTPTEQEEQYSHLLDTTPTENENDFRTFIEEFAKKNSEGKENLTREAAEKDANEAIKLFSSGNSGLIGETNTAAQLNNALGKSNEQQADNSQDPLHPIVGPQTAMLAERAASATQQETAPTTNFRMGR